MCSVNWFVYNVKLHFLFNLVSYYMAKMLRTWTINYNQKGVFISTVLIWVLFLTSSFFNATHCYSLFGFSFPRIYIVKDCIFNCSNCFLHNIFMNSRKYSHKKLLININKSLLKHFKIKKMQTKIKKMSRLFDSHPYKLALIL